jgi:hypothetical protein
MENKNLFTIAEGDFGFKFFIEKAVPLMEDGEMIITGIASTANIDHDNEKMSVEAMSDMVAIINEKSVPLRLEHSKEDSAIIGSVFKSWLDERDQMWIKARVDKNHPAGSILYSALKGGAKMGLSVGGRVKKAVKEFSEKTGRAIKTFYNVLLDEVSITQRPANYDAWLFSKSQKSEITARDMILDKGTFYKQFVFENQQLDYMQAFAKSIDENAWQEVNEPAIINNLIKSMSKITKEEKKDTAEKAEETMETKDKAETKETKETVKAEETETKEKAEETKEDTKKAEDAKETKEKSEEEKETKEKSEDTKETKEKAEETKDEKFKSIVAEGFKTMAKAIEDIKNKMDEKETSKAEEEPKEKAEETETKEKAEEDKEAEKAEETKEKTEDKKETEEKAEDKKEDKTETSEYAIQSSMGKMQAIIKAMEGEDTSDKVTKSINKDVTLDEFVMAMATAIEKMSNKIQANGLSVPGFKKSIVESLKNDSGIQDVIKDMMALPGLKKSVSVGVPYMVMKDGQRFALTASVPEETIIKKSQDGKKASFKDIYKEKYSSVDSE